jgi:hypothetical protein
LGDIENMGDTPKPPAGGILHLITHMSLSDLIGQSREGISRYAPTLVGIYYDVLSNLS